MGTYLPATEGLLSGRLTRIKAIRSVCGEECARTTGQTCLPVHISGGFHLARTRRSQVPGEPGVPSCSWQIHTDPDLHVALSES